VYAVSIQLVQEAMQMDQKKIIFIAAAFLEIKSMDNPVDQLVLLSCSVALVVGLVEGTEVISPVTQVSSVLHTCLSVSHVDAGSSISSLCHMKYFTCVSYLTCFILCLIFTFV
jgi:hypothetical protein